MQQSLDQILFMINIKAMLMIKFKFKNKVKVKAKDIFNYKTTY